MPVVAPAAVASGKSSGDVAPNRPVDRKLLKELGSARWAISASVGGGLVSTAAVVVQAVALAGLLAGAMGGAHDSQRCLAPCMAGGGGVGPWSLCSSERGLRKTWSVERQGGDASASRRARRCATFEGRVA